MKTHCPILSELHPRVRSLGQQGFTLIGLLVVIAIIGILTWLLLPALEQAKVKAKAIAYMNSVRQVDIATKLYINDNNDHFACTFTLEGGEDDQLNSAAGNWGGTAPPATAGTAAQRWSMAMWSSSNRDCGIGRERLGCDRIKDAL